MKTARIKDFDEPTRARASQASSLAPARRQTRQSAPRRTDAAVVAATDDTGLKPPGLDGAGTHDRAPDSAPPRAATGQARHSRAAPQPAGLLTASAARAGHPSGTAASESTGAAGPSSGPLWDPATRAFHGPRLRRAIVARGWTIPEFARLVRAHVTTMYRALKGLPVRDGTAIRIFEGLEKRIPMSVAIGGG